MPNDHDTPVATNRGETIEGDVSIEFNREILAWRNDVLDKSESIDPDGERDWFDLCYGFFLALIPDPDRAMELAVYCEQKGWV